MELNKFTTKMTLEIIQQDFKEHVGRFPWELPIESSQGNYPNRTSSIVTQGNEINIPQKILTSSFLRISQGSVHV
jgi:hypothetical protein